MLLSNVKRDNTTHPGQLSLSSLRGDE